MGWCLRLRFTICLFNNCSVFWLKITSLEGRAIGRRGAGGMGTKTNSAPNFSWVWVWAELGNNLEVCI